MSRRRRPTTRRLLLLGLLILPLLILAFRPWNPDEADRSDLPGDERAAVPGKSMRVAPADGGAGSGAPDPRTGAALAGSAHSDGHAPRGVTITVLDRGGEPIPSISLVLKHADGGVLTSTEADGRKRLDEVGLGSTTLEVCSGSGASARTVVEGPLSLTDVDTVVKIGAVRRVHRRFVDAETGGPLEVDEASCWDGLRSRDVSLDGPADVLTSYHLERHDGRGSFRTRLTAPEGYVHWDQALWHQPLSAYAHALDVVVPLRREAIVRLTVLAHDGTPATNAVVRKFAIPGVSEWRPPAVMQDSFGTFHVKGIPHFRDESLVIWAEIPGTTAFEVLRTRMPADPSEPLVGTIQLPEPEPREPDEEPTSNEAIGLGGGGAGGAFRGRGRATGPRGAAEVRVARADGAPAVGARVQIARSMGVTNKRGVARLSGLPAGEHGVSIEQAGLLPIRGSISISDGDTATLSLHEGKGATVVLEVVDELGHPLPFARFVASVPGDRTQYIDERDGVQRVDRYVDHRGRRTLERMDPRVTRIRLYWASRATTVTVDLSHGKRVPLRVVLPASRGASSR